MGKYSSIFGSSGILAKYWSRAALKLSIEHFDKFIMFAGIELNSLGPTRLFSLKVCILDLQLMSVLNFPSDLSHLNHP